MTTITTIALGIAVYLVVLGLVLDTHLTLARRLRARRAARLTRK